MIQYKNKFFKICLMLVMLGVLVGPEVSQGRLNELGMNFNASEGHDHDGSTKGKKVAASNVTYDNSGSTLAATEVKSGLDELDSEKTNTSDKQTTVTDDDSKYPSSGAVVDYTAADISAHAGVASAHHNNLSNTYAITPSTVTTTGDIKINSDSTSDQILFGTSGDVNLYRAAANQLKTDDTFIIGSNLVVIGGGINIGDVNIYDNGTNQLKTDADFWVGGTTLLIGNDGNIYDNGTNTIKTDDTLQVAGALVLSGDASTITHAETTKIASYNAAEFSSHRSPDLDGVDFSGSHDGYMVPSTADSTYDYAMLGIHLPDGATVIGVSAFGYTEDAGDDVDFYLYRVLLTGPSTSTMAQGGFGGGGISDTDSTITNPVIDNNSYSYKLVAFLQADDTVQDSRLYNMRISYTTTGMSMTQ